MPSPLVQKQETEYDAILIYVSEDVVPIVLLDNFHCTTGLRASFFKACVSEPCDLPKTGCYEGSIFKKNVSTLSFSP